MVTSSRTGGKKEGRRLDWAVGLVPGESLLVNLHTKELALFLRNTHRRSEDLIITL